MLIPIDDRILIPKMVHCTVNGEYINNVNCQNWSVDHSSCKTNCSINHVANPTLEDCKKCDLRKSYRGKKVIEIDDKTRNMKIIDLEHTSVEQPKEPKFMEKAKNYIKAETSQVLQGKVSKEVFEKRKAICMECPYRINGVKGKQDSVGWCKGGCGCSVGNPRATLSQKLYMPHISCPKGKFGTEKGEGFNASDAKDSAKGIIQSVKSLFRKDPKDK